MLIHSSCIAIATPAMCSPGFLFESAVLGLVLLQMCVYFVSIFCDVYVPVDVFLVLWLYVFCFSSCCLMAFCISAVMRWLGFRLAIVSALSPFSGLTTVGLFCPSWEYLVFISVR